MIFEGERPEVWRSVTERVDGGAKVVHEAGKGGLGGAGAAADRTFGLDDGDRAAVAGELDGRREAVGASTDHHSIVNASFGHVLDLLARLFHGRRTAKNAPIRASLLGQPPCAGSSGRMDGRT